MKKIIFILCMLFAVNAQALGLSEHDLALFDALDPKNAKPLPEGVAAASELVHADCIDLYQSSDIVNARIYHLEICQCVKNEFWANAKKENAYEVLYRQMSSQTWDLLGTAMRKCAKIYIR